MYELRFGITGLPFQLSPDPELYFESRSHAHALKELRRGLEGGPGCVVISGEIGSGKTTVVKRLLLEPGAAGLDVALVVSTQLDAKELLVATLHAFGIPAAGSSIADYRTTLVRHLCLLDHTRRRAVLIIDEAQNLSPDALLPLAALVTQPIERLPLQLCLVGQPELQVLMQSAELTALRGSISVSCHLGPLAESEVRPYVEHRLIKVGWSGTPSFDAGAYAEVFRASDGIPRRINLLCNRLMLSRFLASSTHIDALTVAETARALLEEIGAPHLQPSLFVNEMIRASPDSDEPAPPAALPVLADVICADTVLGAETSPGPVLLVAACRSDYVNAAALMRAISSRSPLPKPVLVRVFSDDPQLGTGPLTADLVASDSLADLEIVQVGTRSNDRQIRERFKLVVKQSRPSAIVVFGSTDAALICAIVGRQNKTPVLNVTEDALLRRERAERDERAKAIWIALRATDGPRGSWTGDAATGG